MAGSSREKRKSKARQKSNELTNQTEASHKGEDELKTQESTFSLTSFDVKTQESLLAAVWLLNFEFASEFFRIHEGFVTSFFFSFRAGASLSSLSTSARRLSSALDSLPNVVVYYILPAPSKPSSIIDSI